MSTTSRTSISLNSADSFSHDFTEIDEWLSAVKDGKTLLLSAENSKLNAEIHLAIISEPLEYVSSLCDHLFTLYRDVQNRSFVLQFLPSFLMAYYDVLYHPSVKSADVNSKDVCNTINTFFVGLYNLSILDDNNTVKNQEFRVPNLSTPSIYHTPNADYYAPTPLTQHAVSKHEKKCELIHARTFTPFDTVNTTTREQILWLLLIQYGMHVSFMDAYSRQAYFQMSNKLLGQGFVFNDDISITSTDSILPPTGRRIQVSSRIMTEILGTLFYFKSNCKAKEASECMRLLKQRAEYELYADVILMTESMSFLHEFEAQRPDTIGIEIELPPTLDMVKQKRTATTAKSMKNRHRSHKHHQQTETVIAENDLPNDTIEHLNFVPVPSNADPTAVTPPTSHRNRSILDVLDENTPTTEFIRSTEQIEQSNVPTGESMSPMNTSISSSIGPAASSPSPTSTRQYKPLSLTSTQTYFKTLHQPSTTSSVNPQNIQTFVNNDHDLSLKRSSSMKQQGEKKDLIATVRFAGTIESRTNAKETYL